MLHNMQDCAESLKTVTCKIVNAHTQEYVQFLCLIPEYCHLQIVENADLARCS